MVPRLVSGTADLQFDITSTNHSTTARLSPRYLLLANALSSQSVTKPLLSYIPSTSNFQYLTKLIGSFLFDT